MKTEVKFDDRELIRNYLNGDEQAFELLLKKYKNKVFTSIYLIVKDKELADDIFQDTFIKVINKLKAKKYKEEGKFLPWVLRIARNLCMDHFRKVQKNKIVANDHPEYDIMDNIVSDRDDYAPIFSQGEKKIDLVKYLNMLPDEQREVVLLRHYYDYSFKDIADITGANLNTCLGRMRYALINLKKYIDKFEATK